MENDHAKKSADTILLSGKLPVKKKGIEQ